MKLSSHKNRATQFELCMTPMIDCVFLLLIFFMSTTTFVTAERELNPAISTQQKGGAPAGDLETAVVEVVRGAGGFVFRVGTRELTDKEELVELLLEMGSQSEPALVRVADDVPCWMAAAALQACKDAEYLRVTYEPYEGS